MKDRSHYGRLDKEAVVTVTPEQAGGWLTTRPPAPIMWSRDFPDNEKSHRLADAMVAGEWEVDRPVEPVIISFEAGSPGYCRGGHHRLAAVTHTGKPQDLRIQFYSKPDGWDVALNTKKRQALEEAEAAISKCHICGWHGTPEEIAVHVSLSHKYEV